MAMLRVGGRGRWRSRPRSAHAGAVLLASGILSSFLDNAPTYLAFLSTALSRLFPGVAEGEPFAG
jgi:Na+/H+ antiporter NhaD/arsenite permease-like protein